MVRFRLADHCGYVRTKHLEKATGSVFNLPGLSLADFTITVIELSKRSNSLYRKEREQFHIKRLNTLYKGMNKM